MSYDLAVWDGPLPNDDAAAADEFQRRCEAMMDGTPPTPKVANLVHALTDKFRDLADLEDHEIDGVDTPWASGPLINEACGDFFYFPMTFSGAEAHLDEVVRIVLDHGLVCFDPQAETVHTFASLSQRVALPSPARRVLRAVDRRLQRHVGLVAVLIGAALAALLSKCGGG